MKKIFRLTGFFILIFISYTCEKEYIEPIDIFDTEDLDDPYNLDLGASQGLDTLFVNADRIIETEDGYHIKGTLFSKSLVGIIPVTNGDFKITTDESVSSLKSGFSADFSTFDFTGYGTADFPQVGIMKYSEIDDVPGSYVYYNTGKIFKEESDISQLPLIDERYYFRYKIDDPKKGKEFKNKKASFKLREFYMDAHDPATLFIGDYYSKNSKGVKRLVAEEIGIGLSANELWEFNPYQYSDRLEEAVDGTGFYSINGGVYISGIVPIKKYQVKILGQAVINTSYSSLGNLDIFERGFDEASFQMAANGKLLFDNKLVTFLPGLDTIELGRATLLAELGDDGNAIRMAGEYSNDYLKDFITEKRLKYISFNEKQGVMYLRCTEDLDDFIVYLEENVSFSIPGLGSKELAKSVFKVTKDQVEVSGIITLPYDIGDVEVIGRINADGSFLLKGTANCSVNFGNGLSYNAVLDVEISNEGVVLYGKIDMPYNIGEVEVEGGLTSDEIYLGGRFETSIGFPTDVYLQSDMLLTMSSVAGINLEGEVSLPAGIGDVSVSGEITSQGMELTGEIGSGININICGVKIKTNEEMFLTLSSDIGCIFHGSAKLPFDLGDLILYFTLEANNGISMHGHLTSNIFGHDIDLAVCGTTTTGYCSSYTDLLDINSGVYLDGKMSFPGNKFDLHGSINSSDFHLGATIKEDFGDWGVLYDVYAETTINVSKSGISTSGKLHACINYLFDSDCDSIDADININGSPFFSCTIFGVHVSF